LVVRRTAVVHLIGACDYTRGALSSTGRTVFMFSTSRLLELLCVLNHLQ